MFITVNYSISCLIIAPSVTSRDHLVSTPGPVNEKVSQGVDGVVIQAVFLWEFAGCVGGFGVMITFHCLDQAGAFRRDDQAAFSIAGTDRTTDQFNAFQDAAAFESYRNSK